jgi:hypothetical protein
MLYAKYITLVEDHAEELTKQWIKEINNCPATRAYSEMSDELLANRIFDLYKRLHVWILQNDPGDTHTAEHYIKLGRARANEGLKLSEVTYALILSRVVLWRYIVNQGVIANSFDLQQAFEFFQKVNNFYDKAIYLVSIGYESFKANEGQQVKKEEFIKETVNSITRWLIR